MDCVHTPEQRYGEFSEELHKKAADKRIPISGSLELTFRCNLRCQHCYVAHGHQGIPGKQELTFEEIQHILDEIVDAGCLWFLLTGGEPLMRRDFLDIYKSARQKGLIVSLFTNGTLLTPRIADYLAEWRPFAIEISLYGSTQATYERVTGIPGSFSRCMRGIELLLERELPLKLKSVLMTLNHHELHKMQEFAKNLGCEFRFDPMIDPALEDHAAPLPLRLSLEDIITIEREDPKRSTAWPLHFEESSHREYDKDQLYLCGAGVSGFHIDPYGKLCLCMIDRNASYDLRKGSFKEGWEEFLWRIRSQEHSDKYECASCNLRIMCTQCPAYAQMESGDPEKRVPFLCQLAHLRAKTFHLGWAEKTIQDEVYIKI